MQTETQKKLIKAEVEISQIIDSYFPTIEEKQKAVEEAEGLIKKILEKELVEHETIREETIAMDAEYTDE